MNLLLTLLAPVALVVPAALGGPVAPDTALLPPPERDAISPAAASAREDSLDAVVVEQVRIEQRVVVRIAPPGPALRQTFVAEAAPPTPPRLTERKMGKCLAVAGIAAVQPDAAGKLLLFMRDRRLVSASLEKACSARDFYSGFYLERSADGMLCVDRDKLHSRAGANCAISRIRQLVATDD